MLDFFKKDLFFCFLYKKIETANNWGAPSCSNKKFANEGKIDKIEHCVARFEKKVHRWKMIVKS